MFTVWCVGFQMSRSTTGRHDNWACPDKKLSPCGHNAWRPTEPQSQMWNSDSLLLCSRIIGEVDLWPSHCHRLVLSWETCCCEGLWPCWPENWHISHITSLCQVIIILSVWELSTSWLIWASSYHPLVNRYVQFRLNQITHFKAVITPLGADIIVGLFQHTEDLFLIVWCCNTQPVSSVHIHSDLRLLMVTVSLLSPSRLKGCSFGCFKLKTQKLQQQKEPRQWKKRLIWKFVEVIIKIWGFRTKTPSELKGSYLLCEVPSLLSR